MKIRRSKILTMTLLMLLFQLPLSYGNDLLQNFLQEVETVGPQSGDLIFWATTDLDSVLVQKFTDGPYSHAGIVWVESDQIYCMDIYPGVGIRKLALRDYLSQDPERLTAVALVRFKGKINGAELLKRFSEIFKRKDQVFFDSKIETDNDSTFKTLMEDKPIYLYCTEFPYRMYEGVASGARFSQNDFTRVYNKRDIFETEPLDYEAANVFRGWMGVMPIPQFKNWILNHQSKKIISANGMLRGGGFEILSEMYDPSHFRPWAIRYLGIHNADKKPIENL